MKPKTKLKDLGITERDLNLLEDFVMCVPLCDKHKTWTSCSEEMWLVCDKCARLRERRRKGAFRIMCALFRVTDREKSKK